MRHLIVSVLILLNLYYVSSQTKTDKFNYDKTKEYPATIVQTLELDSLTTFEKVVLQGFDSRIPFYHFINKRSVIKNYVILLHGLGDSKKDWIYASEPYLEWGQNLTSIKDSLLTLGYSLVIPDAKFHGERSYELDFRKPESLPHPISRSEKDTRLFEDLMTTSIKDFRIILDYIERRKLETPGTFNVVGYSMGGNLGILLGISDKRISSIVACVPPLNLPARGLDTLDWPYEILQGQLDITPMSYVQLQNTPIMLLMGKNDYFTTSEEVTKFYERIPIEDKELKYFDSGHILPNHYKSDVIRWISTHN